MKKFNIILAVDNENGVGKCGDLAWRIPDDIKYFKEVTSKTRDQKKQNAVIMGRITWDSIPEKYRPFSGRFNCVLSRSYINNDLNSDGATTFNSLDTCLEYLETLDTIETVFVIGGAELYNISVDHPKLEMAYITRIYNKYHCDTFFNGLPLNFDLISRSKMNEYKGIEYEYSVYTRKQGLLERIKNKIIGKKK